MSLAEASPELAAEWHPTKNGELTPLDVTAGSNKKVWWQKQCNPDEPPHEWPATVNNRRGRKAGCAVCKGFRTQIGVNDLLTTNQQLAAEWHPTKNGELTPLDVTAGSNKKVWWQKQCNPDEPPHEWSNLVNNRSNGEGCSICAGKKVQVGVNDLATRVPTSLLYWHPTKNGELTPLDVTAGSSKRVWWQKQCNPDEPPHEWQGQIKLFATGGQQCSVCSGHQIQIGVNDLSTVRPDLVAEWHPTKNGGLDPHQVTAGTDRKVWWQKQCNPDDPPHEWETAVVNRVAQGQGCAVCRGLQIQVGVNDLATVNPALAAEWHPTRNGTLTPESVALNSHKTVWWQKHCNPDEPPHEWKARLPDRSNSAGCAICHGLQIQVGVNDLGSVNPALAAEWHPTKNGTLTPQEVTFATSRKVWWKCAECSHSWKAAIGNRSSAGTGCPSCAPNTFRMMEKAWLYFLHHPDWAMQQIGITNNFESRLKDHSRNGWVVVEVRGPDEGDQIHSLEQLGLRALKQRGARLGTRRSQHKFDGYTESWPTTSLKLESLQQLLEWIRTDEDTTKSS